jgi:hypothetical protein
MTEERLVLTDLLEKAGDGDFLRAVAETVLQIAEGERRRRADRRRAVWAQRRAEHLAQRLARTFDTRLGALQLRIPKLGKPALAKAGGSYFPPFLEARKSSEKALIAVIQEAWIGGVSTRRVDDLVQAGAVGDQQVVGFQAVQEPALAEAGEIDERVHAFLDRPLGGEWPYLWLDATYLKQREGGPIGVHSRCGLHTRTVTNSWHANRRLEPFRYLHDCSDCFRLELPDRDLLVVLDEAVLDHQEDGEKFIWVFDNREKSNQVSISTFPSPRDADYRAKPGHFGPHNLAREPARQLCQLGADLRHVPECRSAGIRHQKPLSALRSRGAGAAGTAMADG